jgi:hypothetical protein
MRQVLAISLGVLLVAGCSKPAASGGGSAATGGAAPATMANAAPATSAVAAPAGTACDRKLLTPSDLAPLMGATPTIEPLAGDPQSCVFAVGDKQVTVALRPGLGDVTVKTVLSGGENVSATALAGVGDSAAWTPILKEVNATRNNTLCDISFATGGDVTAQQVGALCTKIFAGL